MLERLSGYRPSGRVAVRIVVAVVPAAALVDATVRATLGPDEPGGQSAASAASHSG